MIRNIFVIDNNKFSIRITLLLIFIVLLVYSFTGEKIPHNNGLGWDGLIYMDIAKDIDKLYFNHGIDSYHIQRVLPFAIVHFVLKWLGIDITTSSVLEACNILNFICILFSVFFFYKISNRCKWNPTTESIAFAVCFFNVPVLKIFGYYPVLTDSPSYLLSIMAAYYYLSNNRAMMIITGVMALLTWPILAFVILLLFSFPKSKVLDIDDNDKESIIIFKLLRLGYTFFVPLTFTMFCLIMYYKHPERPFDMYFMHRYAINLFHAILCIITTGCFYYIATRVFYINWRSLFRNLFEKHVIRLIIFSFVIFGFAYKLSIFWGGKARFSPLGQLLVFQEYSSSDILIFLETHFLYLGLFFLLIIFNWSRIVYIVRSEFGIGYFFVILLGLFFVTEIETRKLTSFYPFLLIPLMFYVNTLQLKRWVPLTFILVSLLFSFFWWHINVPGIEDSYIARIDNYRAFPAQRYFMFMGPWQSRMVYLFFSSVEVVVGCFIYIAHKKKWLYKDI